MVAVKKIANTFDNYLDAKRTLREIKLLRHLDHENVGLFPLRSEFKSDIVTIYCPDFGICFTCSDSKDISSLFFFFYN